MTGILLDMDQYTIYAVAMVYWSMSLHLLLGWQWWIGGVGVDAQVLCKKECQFILIASVNLKHC